MVRRTPGVRLLSPFIVWTLTALAILVAMMPTIRATGIEIGDFAINSVLIQDAKSFSLFTGACSRVSFCHPGPAFLYVLALGEIIFHDVLHLTTPIGAQLVAVALLSAGWITSMGYMVMSVTRDRITSLLFIAAFAAMAMKLDHHVIGGLWLPHLYFLPFATFTVAIGLAMLGRTDFLGTLTVSAGFLVHGHVAFVGIVGIAILWALLVNTLMVRSGVLKPAYRWLSMEFLSLHRRSLIHSLIIGSLFLLPILIETVRHFPGPVAQYLSYSSGNNGNDALASFNFVTSYLGAPWIAAAGACILSYLVYKCYQRVPSAVAAVTFLLALFGASIATFVYASRGVDDLSHKYVAIYYYAVPALFVALATALIYRILRSKGFLAGFLGPIAAVLSAVLAVICLIDVRKPPDYIRHFNVPAIAELYDALAKVGSNLVVDADNTVDWGMVWSNLTGVQAYGKRRDRSPFCINRNWHLIFTLQARCTPDQISTGRRMLAAVTTEKDLLTRDPLVRAGDLSFYPIKAVFLPKDKVYDLASHHFEFTSILNSGWSGIETSYVWSDGPEQRLDVALPPDAVRLKIDLSAFVPGEHQQAVEIKVEDGPATLVQFDKNRPRQWVSVELEKGKSEVRNISIFVRHPLSPKELGMSADSRRLGVALWGFQVE